MPMNEKIQKALKHCIAETHFDWGPKISGKVRDTYDLGDKLALVTTDRQSAFDRVLAAVPYKGEVLTQCSAWWFEKTKHIIKNHMLAVPQPNVMHVKKCDVFPIEFVVRGYITGTTNTALWTQYNQGVRQYCGHDLPEGLQKNQQLEKPLVTPTTKEIEHDRPISAEEIVSQALMTQADWDYASEKAQALYAFGAEVAKKHGLILVDTKYEMGKDAQGNILLIDECHTPDSSRYWAADTYLDRFVAGEEPDNFDKEFLRLWFSERCDPYHDATLPEAPEALILTLSQRYIALYEKITGLTFSFSEYAVIS